ncbi:MAG: glycosyltransferase [Cyanobacteria bacterium P01_E01_bin.34]
MNTFDSLAAGVNALLLGGSLAVGGATAVLLLETLAAILAKAEEIATDCSHGSKGALVTVALPRIAVLIPAHNEADNIATVVCEVRQQLGNGDRLIVVADNCTDDTAAIARSCGAEVIERLDLERCGKGYAIDFGMQYLSASPPDIVVMLDADCHVEGGGIARIALLAHETGKPIQATYILAPLLDADERDVNTSPKTALSAFAFRVKNYVRPLGLHRLGFPCLLTGTGMAIPWTGLTKVDVASGNIVEDMKLGLDLALKGYAPRFCHDVQVTGTLPEYQEDAIIQRRRWEHGHLTTMLTDVPRLLFAAVRQCRFDLLALALEVSVPPLSLLMLLWAILMSAAGGWWLGTGGYGPVLVLSAAGGCLVVAVLGSWMLVGRQLMSLKTLLSVPFYVLWKLPLYVGFLGEREQQWVRTKRASEL